MSKPMHSTTRPISDLCGHSIRDCTEGEPEASPRYNRHDGVVSRPDEIWVKYAVFGYLRIGDVTRTVGSWLLQIAR